MRKTKFLGKVLSLALVVTLIAGMVPEMRTKAAEGENSGWIQVTEDNKDDLDTKVAVLDNLSQTTYDNFIFNAEWAHSYIKSSKNEYYILGKKGGKYICLYGADIEVRSKTLDTIDISVANHYFFPSQEVKLNLDGGEWKTDTITTVAGVFTDLPIPTKEGYIFTGWYEDPQSEDPQSNKEDKEHLLEDGYDMNEIGSKYVDNFIKQVMDDGFFHADPHPGNVRIRDGKIVWIDMGMMGRLTERDREQIAKAVEGVALNDIGMIQDAVLALGEFRGEPDPSQLYKDIRGLMAKYGTADMGNIDVAEVLQDLMDVMKENKITMPHGLTMLARGLAHVEGVLADISPQINMVEIAASRLKSQFIQNHDWKKEAKSGAKSIYLSMRKAVDIPALVADLLDGYMKGQTRINLDLHAGEDLANLLRRVTRNVVMGLWVMALLISSSIICTTDMKPKILGIPALGAIGYLGAFVIVLYVFIKHIFSRK